MHKTKLAKFPMKVHFFENKENRFSTTVIRIMVLLHLENLLLLLLLLLLLSPNYLELYDNTPFHIAPTSAVWYLDRLWNASVSMKRACCDRYARDKNAPFF